jgi:hypothetical protein
MITKKQKMLRYIDNNVPRYATKKLIVKDTLGNSYKLSLPKLELISTVIRNFNDDCQGRLRDSDPFIEVLKYEIV